MVVITEESNLEEKELAKPLPAPESRVVRTAMIEPSASDHWTYELVDRLVGDQERAGPKQPEWMQDKGAG